MDLIKVHEFKKTVHEFEKFMIFKQIHLLKKAEENEKERKNQTKRLNTK